MLEDVRTAELHDVLFHSRRTRMDVSADAAIIALLHGHGMRGVEMCGNAED